MSTNEKREEEAAKNTSKRCITSRSTSLCTPTDRCSRKNKIASETCGYHLRTRITRVGRIEARSQVYDGERMDRVRCTDVHRNTRRGEALADNAAVLATIFNPKLTAGQAPDKYDMIFSSETRQKSPGLQDTPRNERADELAKTRVEM